MAHWHHCSGCFKALSHVCSERYTSTFISLTQIQLQMNTNVSLCKWAMRSVVFDGYRHVVSCTCWQSVVCYPSWDDFITSGQLVMAKFRCKRTQDPFEIWSLRLTCPHSLSSVNMGVCSTVYSADVLWPTTETKSIFARLSVSHAPIYLRLTPQSKWILTPGLNRSKVKGLCLLRLCVLCSQETSLSVSMLCCFTSCRIKKLWRKIFQFRLGIICKV